MWHNHKITLSGNQEHHSINCRHFFFSLQFIWYNFQCIFSAIACNISNQIFPLLSPAQYSHTMQNHSLKHLSLLSYRVLTFWIYWHIGVLMSLSTGQCVNHGCWGAAMCYCSSTFPSPHKTAINSSTRHSTARRKRIFHIQGPSSL